MSAREPEQMAALYAQHHGPFASPRPSTHEALPSLNFQRCEFRGELAKPTYCWSTSERGDLHDAEGGV